MNATISPEYRKLEIDSSNDMIRHDARRGDRKYPEAALHIRNAGFARLRMGQIMLDAEDVTQAACDWLSAAACFDLVPDLERMKECFERARKLDQDGKIPLERRDIHAALKEREEELKALDEKLKQFSKNYDRVVGPEHIAKQEALDWLLSQVRDLPGLPYLHMAITSQAMQLRQFTLAFRHEEWAENIDRGNPQLEALLASLLLVSGEIERGILKSRELLKAHPKMHDLRVLLAQFVAFPAKGVKGDLEDAIRILQPLVEDDYADARTQLTALTLATILQHELKHDGDYRRLLSAFDKLAEANWPVEQDFVTTRRQALPHIFPQPGSNGAAHPPIERRDLSPQSDRRPVDDVVRELNPLTAGAAA